MQRLASILVAQKIQTEDFAICSNSIGRSYSIIFYPTVIFRINEIVRVDSAFVNSLTYEIH